MNKIVYKTDTGISIVHFSEGRNIEDVIRKSVPEGAEYYIIDESEIPKDRSLRNAWYYDNGIKINQTKADEIMAKKEANKKPTIEDIEGAKTIADLKVIMKKLL